MLGRWWACPETTHPVLPVLKPRMLIGFCSVKTAGTHEDKKLDTYVFHPLVALLSWQNVVEFTDHSEKSKYRNFSLVC